MTPSANALAAPCPTQYAILSALWYFGIFRHPLTADEVYAFANCPGVDPSDFSEKMEELLAEGHIFQFGEFYQPENDPSWAPRRQELNRRAAQYLPIAKRMARLIGRFPFIRAVFVSGSLSKNCMPADGDIDYFLITTPGRLWLARTLLVVFKKLFLFNSHKYFCVNYFIDTEHLEIEEKNLFTATEISTLLPLYGAAEYELFYRANGWVKNFLPHLPPRPTAGIVPHRNGLIKRMLERALGGRFGAWLDTRAMRLTVGYWRRKFSHLDDQTFDSALKSRRYVSKHHPLYYQKKVLTAFEERLNRGLSN